MTKPTKPPVSGPAVEVPPASDEAKPRVTVYRHPRPLLWIFWPDRWTLATVLARHDYDHGVVYQVELTPSADSHSKVIRSFAWGRDNLRAAQA